MNESCTALRVAHVAWGYLGGGVDSVLDSYLEADLYRPDRVISHVVVVRRSDAEEQKKPKAGGGSSLVTRSAREIRTAARETAERIHDFSPDIVLLHGFNATILGHALRRILPADLPIVSTYHGKYFALSLAERAKAALLNRLETSFFRKHACAVIAVSSHSASQLQANGVPTEKIVVLHNAVSLGSPPLSAKTHSAACGRHRVVKIVTVSRLAPQKGVDVLLSAFAKLAAEYPKVTLDIVGDGPLRAELELVAQELKISGSVRFLGNRTDVAELLSNADIFAMTSRQEDHSVSILEAMRAGLPLVVTDVGGNRESVRDGVDGYLVPDLDDRAAASALKQLVASSELRALFGAAGRSRYESLFESKIMIDRFIASIERLAREPEGCADG